ncbi:MAG: ABC transporter ATP-binding protein [Clostridium sp.]|nr:ABC transporter ATP-binding protein [Clostridium sp.]MDD7139573.1 ABC transporter ATP-binding protein [Clostridium sp.]MDY6080688.1 ABC transporter ATP-binding protein [Eubacteriales bacterium]
MLEMKAVKIVFHAGTVNEKTALAGVDLHLAPGEFVTVIGGNGAGKSTLLNCVSGTYAPTSGEIWIDGQNVTHMPEHRRAKLLGRVFQDPMMGTAGNMWIEENLALALRRGQKRGLRWGITQKEREMFKEQLRRLDLGLEDRLSTKVKLLSGGQRQALTLLMATLQKPKLLLLDEHTAALDPKTARKVLELSEQIIEEHGLTSLMVTHNMRDAIRYGNRLIMMHNGRVAVDVSGEEKKKLTVEALLERFSESAGSDEVSDRLVL